MKDLECPYCGHEQDVCHDDGFGYSEDELHEVECDACEKTYGFRTIIILHYDPVATPCLNGEPHQWKDARRYTSKGTEVFERCEACDKKQEKPAAPAGGGE